MGTETTKGSAAATANPSWRRWLRGLDLNQRPLGYEGMRYIDREPQRANPTHIYRTPFRPVLPRVTRSTRKEPESVGRLRGGLPLPERVLACNSPHAPRLPAAPP